jgi:hypothetical protein
MSKLWLVQVNDKTGGSYAMGVYDTRRQAIDLCINPYVLRLNKFSYFRESGFELKRHPNDFFTWGPYTFYIDKFEKNEDWSHWPTP